MFVAKAERIDTTQLEIEFAATLAALDALAGTAPSDIEEPGSSEPGPTTTGPRGKAKPTGRRDLRDEGVPVERVLLSDPTLDGTPAQIRLDLVGVEVELLQQCFELCDRVSCARVLADIVRDELVRLLALIYRRDANLGPAHRWVLDQLATQCATAIKTG